MKRAKILSFFLIMMLVLQSIPISYAEAAGNNSVWVNGIDVANIKDPLPTGIAYEPKTKTLTLNGANINIGHLNGDIYSGICTEGDLNIVLINGNTITITGDESGRSYEGVSVNNGNLSVSGTGTLNITGKDKSFSVIGKNTENQGDITFSGSISVETHGEIYVSNVGSDLHGMIHVKDTAVVRFFNGYFATNGFTCDPTAKFENGNPGPGPGLLSNLYINGIDYTSESPVVIPGVTVSDLTKSSVTITLNNAVIDAGILDGECLYGIYSNGLAVNLVLSGENEINVKHETEKRTCGISVNDGTLTISNNGSLKVYGSDSSINLTGGNTVTELSFKDSVCVTAFGEIRCTTNLEGSGKIYLKNTAILQCYGGYFSPAGDIIKDPTAKYNSVSFIIDGQTIDADTTGFTDDEVTIAEGNGWKVKAVADTNPETGIKQYNINLLLMNYSSKAIECYNFNGFLYIGGICNIEADSNGYSMNFINSKPQVWSQDENEKQNPVVNMQGGIKFYYGGLNPWYSGTWNIGTESTPSQKGITGTGGNCELNITRDNFTIYTTDKVISGLNKLLIEDDALFKATTTGKAIENTNTVTVSTSGKIDIAYNNDGSRVIDDSSITQSALIFRSDDPTATNPFPAARQYEINCMNNTYLLSRTDPCSKPDFSIAGKPVTSEDIKYKLTDTGSRYFFESTANKITRVFADDAKSLVGGTLEVVSVNGYNFGGYVAEVGKPVYVRVLPKAGYQYKPGTLLCSDGLVISPTEEAGVYSFIMPDTKALGVGITCKFEKCNDLISFDSDIVSDGTILVPQGVISHGNAKFTVTDKIVSDAEKEAVIGKSGDYIIGAYFDIKLDEIITKNGSLIDVWSTSLSELENPIIIKLKLGDKISGYEKYSIVRIHNGEANTIDAQYENGSLTFETDKFSTYAIIYSKESTNTEQVETLKTGDTLPSLWLFVITLVSGIGVLVLRKKNLQVIKK